MAERRMFAKAIIDSDAFLEMPISARLLYYDLAMRADDDGFVNSPRKIMKFVGATNDDMNILIARKFVISFENGVVVIKHWRIHNYIRKDTYKETTYKEEKALLSYDENNAYTMTRQLPVDGTSTERRRNEDDPSTQVSIGKDSIGKNKDSMRFTPPTLEEIKAYVAERGNLIDPKKFFDYYTAADWKDSKGQKVKNWKQKAITWERQRTEKRTPDFTNPYKNMAQIAEKEKYEKSMEEFRRMVEALENEEH